MSRLWRPVVAACVGVVAFHFSLARQAAIGGMVDVAPVIASARAIIAGLDPYAVTGPNAPFFWPWHQPYPATAFVALLPLTVAPERIAVALFLALSLAWLAYAAWNPKWIPMFFSGAMVFVLLQHQWTPFLMAAVLTPACSGLLAVKPTMGAALLAGADRRTIARSFIGGSVLAAAAFALRPTWVIDWLRVLRSEEFYFVAPITRLPWGPLVLLALLRWRRPEARLLVALACVPQTNGVSDALPLFLVCATFWESALLAATTGVVAYYQLAFPLPTIGARYAAHVGMFADWLVWAAFLPCLAMVLLRRSDHASWKVTEDRSSLSEVLPSCRPPVVSAPYAMSVPPEAAEKRPR